MANQWKLIGDEWEESFPTQRELIDSVLVWEADAAVHNGADVTDDCASAWWSAHGEAHGNLPEMFRDELQAKQWEAQDGGYVDPNAEHSTHYRGIGI